MNEAISFADFQEVGVNQESERLPMRPTQGEMAIIKHNAQTGKLSLLLANGDTDPDVVKAKSISFATTLVYGFVKGSDDSGNTYMSSITNNPYFDIYKTGDNKSESLGISKKPYDVTEKSATRQTRIFGVLRSVDGKNPMNNEIIAKHFEGKAVVPFLLDLPYSKVRLLIDLIGRSWSRVIKTSIVTISGGMDDDLEYKINSANYKATMYHPKFKVETDDEALKKLASVAQDFLHTCFEYSEDVKKHDEFISELYRHNLCAPDVVNNLSDMGISNKNDIENYFKDNNTDWNGLKNDLAEMEGKPFVNKEIKEDPFKDNADDLIDSINEGLEDSLDDNLAF